MDLRASVCMCLWKRLENIPAIIDALENQTYSNFDFNIWDNSGKLEYPETFLDLNIYSNNKNEGSQARFWLVPETTGNPIIFFDDDQIPKEDFVEYMVTQYIENPFSVQSWKTRVFVHESYWKESNRPAVNGEVDYCGTGGMVLDRFIFNDDRLINIPDPFKQVEDLWLSYIARAKGFKLLKIRRRLTKVRDQFDQHKLHKLGKTKELCFKTLRNEYNWKILKDNDIKS